MALKTFNVDEKVYKEFSKHCKQHGISMSRRVEKFIKEELDNLKNSGRKITTSQKQFSVDKIENIKIEEHPLSKYC